MPSPFPGMDPWLESQALFPDFHNRFIAYLSEAIGAKLARPFYTAIATRVYVEESDRHVEPDIDVLQAKGRRRKLRSTDDGGGTAVAVETGTTPVIVRVPSDEVAEWVLEIRNANTGDRLVTSVEVLSRTNKLPRSKGRRLYLTKRRELFRGRVNTVEIDLLRSGAHTTAVPLARASRQTGPFDYHVCAHRAARPEEYEVYPILLSQRLPAVRVPLTRTAADVVVELQPALDRCYEVGTYDLRARYGQPPDPPLTPEQAEWAAGVLRAKGVTSHA